jgi:hypothetical protein
MMSLADFAKFLDPGIRDLVMFLNGRGWETIDSGDGYSKAGMSCARDHAHVVVKLPDAYNLSDRAIRLAKDVRDFTGEPSVEIGKTGGWCLQATYDPVTNVATCDVMKFTTEPNIG